MSVLVQVLQFEGPIGQGASNGQWVQLRAAFKTNQPDQCTVQAEHIAARIAALLGLPCPGHSLIELPGGEIGFVSLKFGDVHGNVAPATPPDLAMTQPDLSAGIIAFDVLIGNSDRHAGNIAHAGSGAPIIFDHSHALSAGSSRPNLLTLDARKDDAIANQCLEQYMSTSAPFLAWIDRIVALPEYLLRAPIDELQQLGMLDSQEATNLFAFLAHRRTMIAQLLRQQLQGITDWPNP